jgi:hypothetical protein
MAMRANTIMVDIAIELKMAKKKFPNWPDHPAAQAGIVCEEAGELMRACLQWKYERANEEIVKEVQRERMREEAIHTAVTAIRFLENFEP